MALALLALALRRDSAWFGFLVGFAWGLPFFLVHIWWAQVTVGPVPWIALSAAQGVAIGLFGAAWVWVRRWRAVQRHASIAVVSFALVWTAVEAGRSVAPWGGFPWGRIAFSQVNGPLLRPAAWGGTALVAFVVAALGALGAVVWTMLRRARVLQAALALVPLVAVPLLAATIPLDTRSEGSIRVGVVQGNVSTPGLEAFENAREVIANHVAGTLELAAAQDAGAPRVDLVLWPENAADYDPRTDAQAAAEIERAATAIDAPILLGTQSYERDSEGRAVARYNDMVLWLPREGAVAVYAKQHPVPFAEYVPYKDFFRNFSSAVDLVSVEMAPGGEVGVIEVPVGDQKVPIGVATCFEVAYDALVTSAVRAGAEVLVVPTNNASFGYTAESEQQLAMSVFRAVETGRATVQVSTVGVSGVVTPNGVVLEQTDLFVPAVLTADLPLRTALTPAVRLGAWPTYACWGASALLLVLGVAHRRRADGGAPAVRGSGRGTTSGPAARTEGARVGDRTYRGRP